MQIEQIGVFTVTTKYKRPIEVVMWDEYPSRPKNCWFCNHFNRMTAECDKFQQVVPENFVNQKDKCSSFDCKIPF